jgi:hypothetical protein
MAVGSCQATNSTGSEEEISAPIDISEGLKTHVLVSAV